MLIKIQLHPVLIGDVTHYIHYLTNSLNSTFFKTSCICHLSVKFIFSFIANGCPIKSALNKANLSLKAQCITLEILLSNNSYFPYNL
jgi:hypothetical protein